MVGRRAVLIALGLVVAAGVAGAAWIAQRDAAEEKAFIRKWPEALVYKGITLYADSDIEGAVEAWDQYLRIAPPGSDTVGIRELIGEARRSMGTKSR